MMVLEVLAPGRLFCGWLQDLSRAEDEGPSDDSGGRLLTGKVASGLAEPLRWRMA